MIFRNLLLAILLVLTGFRSETLAQQPRSINFSDFIRIVMNFHPVARQARLVQDAAKAELMKQKGALDPKLSSMYEEKNFSEKNYLRAFTAEMKIPTWYGPEIKAGYESILGDVVNPESRTPSAGLPYAGLSIPIGQGLFIDSRRAAIKVARIGQDLALAERIKLVNKLYLEAGKEYWDWTAKYRRMSLQRIGLGLALDRFKAVKERVIQGDLPGLDTVEARVEVQNRTILYLQASLDNKNALFELSNFLWNENMAPLELDTTWFPIDTVFSNTTYLDSLRAWISFASLNHPDIRITQNKLAQGTIYLKNSRDQLKPDLRLNYNLLGESALVNASSPAWNFLQNNYKWGLTFSYPLLLRKERASVNLAKISLTRSRLELDLKRKTIETDIFLAHNKLAQQVKQRTELLDLIRYASLLRDGEQLRFIGGESSFFLVNTREINLINQQIRMAELIASLRKSELEMMHASGLLLWAN